MGEVDLRRGGAKCRRHSRGATVSGSSVGISAPSLPHHRVVDRPPWIGAKHTTLHHHILALVRHWGAVWIIVDATGIGAGLASFLQNALGEKVIPITFSPETKSEAGWNFLAIVETGRYQDYAPGVGADSGAPDTRQFWYEVEACQYQVREGPNKLLSWGVWDTPAYDGRIAHGHDDLLISAALCAILDQHQWPTTGPSTVVQRADPLTDIDAAPWD